MSLATVTPVADALPKEDREKLSAPKAETARGQRPMTTPRGAKGVNRERYFLAKSVDNGFPSLGSELESESEAIIHAFRDQTTFFVVTEWKVGTKIAGTIPQLVKEGVARSEKS